MSHIFISYSRKDITVAQKIVTALAENNLDTWIDWKSIPKGEDWEQEIYRGIEEADAFLFLISPDSIASDMCNKEITHAAQNGKRILPIVLHDIDTNFIRPEISKPNWIFCRNRQDNFREAIDQIRTAIHTDYEWLRYHTKLQIKALDWERSRQKADFLLYGELLSEAEKWLGNPKSVSPEPTPLMMAYLLAGQREFQRRRDEEEQRKKKTNRRIWQSAGISSGMIILVSCVFLWLLGGGWAKYFTTTAPLNYNSVDSKSIQIAQQGVSANRGWTPAIKEFDGVKMALVPAGCFTMGSSAQDIESILALCEKEREARGGSGTCDRTWFDDVRVQTKVCFDKPFWIDVYEVTNAQFKRLIGSAAMDNGRNDGRPRDFIAWVEAAKFCQDRGGRLPTEAEWEYAARGPDGLVYPWGNEFNPKNLAYGNTGFFSHSQSSMVGNFPNGASWVGALDMSGNLWEWTNSLYAPYPYDPNDGREVDGQQDGKSNRVSRGGSFQDNGVNMGAANRLQLMPTARDQFQGFRCAMDFRSTLP